MVCKRKESRPGVEEDDKLLSSQKWLLDYVFPQKLSQLSWKTGSAKFLGMGYPRYYRIINFLPQVRS